MIILTGPPGSGKTSIIAALRQRGITCVDEFARKVIAEERRTGGRGTSEKDQALFVELMLIQAKTDYQDHMATTEPVIFDRGVPDLIAYAETFGLDTSEIRAMCKLYPCNRTVLFTPFWPEIYTPDEERRATAEQAEVFGDFVRAGYESENYRLVEIPRAQIEERIDFVVEQIDSLSAPEI